MKDVTIFFRGNCHAANFARLIVNTTDANVVYLDNPFSFMRAVAPGRMLYVSLPHCREYIGHLKAQGRRVVLLEQISPIAKRIGLEDIFDAVFVFPHVEIQAYFPHMFLKPDWNQTMEPRALKRILQRRLDIDLAAIARSVSFAGWPKDLVDIIRTTHAKRPLFHTHNHPGTLLCHLVYRPVVEALIDGGFVNKDAAASIAQSVEIERGIGFLSEHPLRAATLDALDLKWADVSWYALWVEATERAHRSDLVGARDLLIEALNERDCDKHAWFGLARTYEALGATDRAHACYAAVASSFPDNSYYAHEWIRTASAQPESALAAEFVRSVMEDRTGSKLRTI